MQNKPGKKRTSQEYNGPPLTRLRKHKRTKPNQTITPATRIQRQYNLRSRFGLIPNQLERTNKALKQNRIEEFFINKKTRKSKGKMDEEDVLKIQKEYKRVEVEDEFKNFREIKISIPSFNNENPIEYYEFCFKSSEMDIEEILYLLKNFKKISKENEKLEKKSEIIIPLFTLSSILRYLHNNQFHHKIKSLILKTLESQKKSSFWGRILKVINYNDTPNIIIEGFIHLLVTLHENFSQNTQEKIHPNFFLYLNNYKANFLRIIDMKEWQDLELFSSFLDVLKDYMLQLELLGGLNDEELGIRYGYNDAKNEDFTMDVLFSIIHDRYKKLEKEWIPGKIIDTYDDYLTALLDDCEEEDFREGMDEEGKEANLKELFEEERSEGDGDEDLSFESLMEDEEPEEDFEKLESILYEETLNTVEIELKYKIFRLIMNIRVINKSPSPQMFITWQRFLKRIKIKRKIDKIPKLDLDLIESYISYEHSLRIREAEILNMHNNLNFTDEELDDIREERNDIITTLLVRISPFLRKLVNIYFYSLNEKEQFNFVVTKAEKFRFKLYKLVYYMKPECLIRLFCKSNFNFGELKFNYNREEEEVQRFRLDFDSDTLRSRNYLESLIEMAFMKNEEMFEKFKTGILNLLKRKTVSSLVSNYPWFEKILNFLVRDDEEKYKEVDLKNLKKDDLMSFSEVNGIYKNHRENIINLKNFSEKKHLVFQDFEFKDKMTFFIAGRRKLKFYSEDADTNGFFFGDIIESDMLINGEPSENSVSEFYLKKSEKFSYNKIINNKKIFKVITESSIETLRTGETLLFKKPPNSLRPRLIGSRSARFYYQNLEDNSGDVTTAQKNAHTVSRSVTLGNNRAKVLLSSKSSFLNNREINIQHNIMLLSTRFRRKLLQNDLEDYSQKKFLESMRSLFVNENNRIERPAQLNEQEREFMEMPVFDFEELIEINEEDMNEADDEFDDEIEEIEDDFEAPNVFLHGVMETIQRRFRRDMDQPFIEEEVEEPQIQNQRDFRRRRITINNEITNTFLDKFETVECDFNSISKNLNQQNTVILDPVCNFLNSTTFMKNIHLSYKNSEPLIPVKIIPSEEKLIRSDKVNYFYFFYNIKLRKFQKIKFEEYYNKDVVRVYKKAFRDKLIIHTNNFSYEYDFKMKKLNKIKYLNLTETLDLFSEKHPFDFSGTMGDIQIYVKTKYEKINSDLTFFENTLELKFSSAISGEEVIVDLDDEGKGEFLFEGYTCLVDIAFKYIYLVDFDNEKRGLKKERVVKCWVLGYQEIFNKLHNFNK